MQQFENAEDEFSQALLNVLRRTIDAPGRARCGFGEPGEFILFVVFAPCHQSSFRNSVAGQGPLTLTPTSAGSFADRTLPTNWSTAARSTRKKHLAPSATCLIL